MCPRTGQDTPRVFPYALAQKAKGLCVGVWFCKEGKLAWLESSEFHSLHGEQGDHHLCVFLRNMILPQTWHLSRPSLVFFVNDSRLSCMATQIQGNYLLLQVLSRSVGRYPLQRLAFWKLLSCLRSTITNICQNKWPENARFVQLLVCVCHTRTVAKHIGYYSCLDPRQPVCLVVSALHRPN